MTEHDIYKFTENSICKFCSKRSKMISKGKDGLDYQDCLYMGSLDDIVKECKFFKSWI